jgi:periplasmic protein TonB
MLRTLFESKSAERRITFGTAASVAVHLILIGAAAFVTTAAAKIDDSPEKPTKLIYVKPMSHVAVSRTSRQTTTPRNALPSQLPRSVSVSVDIPTSLPALTASLAVAGPSDFPATATSFGPTGSDTITANSSNARRAYDVHEVERAAYALGGNAGPQYPSALRSAGLEGQVVVQFIVNTDGRADAGSIRVVSATNDLFSAAVQRALPKMRFAPALIGRKAVPQFVQQLFVFKLDR